MIIPIPRDETYSFEPEKRSNDWYQWYLNCRSWKCQCGITNFGRNLFCADRRCKKPRPESYDEGNNQ